MTRRALLAVLMAVALEVQAGPLPPDEAEMDLHRAKAEQWSATLPANAVIANLQAWFGRYFTGEPSRNGMVDIYVVTYKWSNAVNRNEVVHRFKVATVAQ